MKGERRIKERHLERRAVVYVRQSTPGQVLSNRESTRLQYGLREQAEALGWPSQRIETIDEDLGVSGSGEVDRPGFRRLTLEVARGQVGTVFGLDPSRLSRDTAEWFELLRWLRATDTLLVVGGKVYDPGRSDEKLLLGIQGTVSEQELLGIRRRMDEGLRNKARRGELYRSVPSGYVRDGTGLRKDPDEQVRHAIGQVFAKFRELGSARQVVRALRAGGTKLPGRRHPGAQVTWRKASYSRVLQVLRNPLMGGAYAYGRQRTEVQLDERGRLRKRVRRLPLDKWEVLIEGHHEGYVTWAEWLEIQQRLERNANTSRGAPREGRALLQGLAVCGHCGRAMHVRYGKGVSYVCRGPTESAGAGICQSAGAVRVDKLAAAAFLEAAGPGGVEAALRAERLDAEREEEWLRSYRLELERKEYEERKAECEYREVEAGLRLVKRTLGRDWEQAQEAALRARRDLERAVERLPRRGEPPATELFARLGTRLRALWEHPALRMRDRKRLLATLLEEAVLRADRKARTLSVVLRWRGGWVDEHELPAYRSQPPQPRRDDVGTVEMVRRLARFYPDGSIALTLGKQGRKTARGLPFTRKRVASLRTRHGIAACPPQANDNEAPTLRVAEAARELGTSPSTLYRWIQQGFVPATRPVPGAPWLVRLDAALRARFCDAVLFFRFFVRAVSRLFGG